MRKFHVFMADLSFHGKLNSETHFVLPSGSIYVVRQEIETGLECKDAFKKILQLASGKLSMPKYNSKKWNSKIS